MKTNYRTPLLGLLLSSSLLVLSACTSFSTSTSTVENDAKDDMINNEKTQALELDQPKQDSAKTSQSSTSTTINKKQSPAVIDDTSSAPSSKKNTQEITKRPTVTKEQAKATVETKPKTNNTATSTAAVKSQSKSKTSKPKAKTSSKKLTAVAVKKPSTKNNKPTANNNLVLNGKVRLLGDKGNIMSADGIIVLLEPVVKTGHTRKTSTQPMIDMLDKKYTPAISTIASKSKVQFRNKDQVKHNVFSSSGMNSFDLGTYGKGKVSSASFDQSGIVKVYCNIHPDMVAFIGVSDFNYSSITNNKGEFSIKGLLPGKYSITVWSPRGEIKQTIYIADNKANNKNFTLNTASFKKTQHKNKYGKSYEEQSLFDDEFY